MVPEISVFILLTVGIFLYIYIYIFFKGLITHLVLNLCPMFHNGPHPLKCLSFVKSSYH